MSRTKAGTSALLLIGALRTGSSAFTAAQCISELLVLSGCETDKVPNVDVLRAMVTYLAPFVHDLGFSKVLQHITTSCEHTITRLQKGVPEGLTAIGEARVLAGAIRQLCLTSEREESIYLVVGQRAAWLAAFASHLLGSAVDMLLDDTVVWAAAGSKGRITLQLQCDYKEAVTHGNLQLIPAPESYSARNPLVLEYALGDALEAELGKLPVIDDDLTLAIQSSVVRSSFRRVMAKSRGPESLTRLLRDSPTTKTALTQTLIDFNIPSEVQLAALANYSPLQQSPWLEDHPLTDDPIASIVASLDHGSYGKIKKYCGIHSVEATSESYEYPSGCLCSHIGHLITSISMTAIALSRCVYNTKEIRLQSAILDGTHVPLWLVPGAGKSTYSMSYNGPDTWLIFEFLSIALMPAENRVAMSMVPQLQAGLDAQPVVLGVSGGNYTVLYTGLLDTEAFDDCGRVITIASGRASVTGILRNLIFEDNNANLFMSQTLKYPVLPVLSPGSFLKPHYCPGPFKIFMDASLSENAIIIKTRVGLDPMNTSITLFSHSLRSFLSISVLSNACDHPSDQPYQLPATRSYRLAPFYPFNLSTVYSGELIVHALQGNRLEQMFQIPWLPDVRVSPLQMRSCLRCIFAERSYRNTIIMGG
jgi:hypothetical protein